MGVWILGKEGLFYIVVLPAWLDGQLVDIGFGGSHEAAS